MAKTLKDISPSLNPRIQIKYNGTVQKWMVIAHDQHKHGCTTLYPVDTVIKAAFDAEEPSNPNSDRKSYGNNNWEVSNLRQWLNSDSKDWYKKQHQYDQPPTDNYVTSNPYADKPGYLTGFDPELVKHLEEVTITTARPTTDGGGSYTTKDKVFLLSQKELFNENENGVAEGKHISLFSSDSNRKSDTLYYMRSPIARYADIVRYVHSDGSLNNHGAYRGYSGVRPALVLQSSIPVFDRGDGEYELFNTAPTVQDKTTSGKTLYEQNILNINGSAMDTDANDVVSVKYRVNSGTTRPLATGIGSTSYNKSLQFKQGYLYDGDTKVSTQLSDGTQHNIRLWAEDDNGAKSEEVVITFYVVNNRPSKLQINQILEQNDLVESDTVLLTGRVEDPEGHDTTIFYRVGGSSYSKVNTGKDRDFEIRIPVSKLINGENLVTIRSEDTYGAITERTVRLTKSGISTPLKTGVIEYKLTPPDKVAKGLLIWIQREIGDLSTKVEVKFGNNPYKTLEKNHVGLVTEGLEEDEYVYENDTEESDIRIRITMSRMSTSSNKAIKKISGVFN